MRVMVFVKATEDSEKGILPTKELLEAMGRYNEELTEALFAGQAHRLRRSQPQRHRRSVRRDARTGRRLLALGGQGHGRGRQLGEALPQSHAGTERTRDPPALRDGRFSMNVICG